MNFEDNNEDSAPHILPPTNIYDMASGGDSTSPSPTTDTTSSMTTISARPTVLPKHPFRHNITAAAANHPYNPEKWKVPTILALTIAISLGSALAVFLTFIAWRKIRNLQQLRRRDAERGMREVR